MGGGFIHKFKVDYPLEKRLKAAENIIEKYPNRIPVIVENMDQSNLPTITKNKFLVPGDLTVGKFIYELRKHLTLKSDQAVFTFVGAGVLPPTAALMSQIYQRFKDEDRFLYMFISGESTFG